MTTITIEIKNTERGKTYYNAETGKPVGGVYYDRICPGIFSASTKTLIDSGPEDVCHEMVKESLKESAKNLDIEVKFIDLTNENA